MTENSTVEDLKPLVDQLEDDLRQLKSMIEQLSDASASPQLEDKPKPLNKPPADRGRTGAAPAAADKAAAVTLMEPEEFIQEVEKLQRHDETMDRLTILERQNRRLILLGGMIVTIMLVSISIMLYLMAHPEYWSKVP